MHHRQLAEELRRRGVADSPQCLRFNAKMSSLPGNFVDRIDPFAKRSLKKKSKKSQGSSRYRNSQDVELQQLPQLKG